MLFHSYQDYRVLDFNELRHIVNKFLFIAELKLLLCQLSNEQLFMVRQIDIVQFNVSTGLGDAHSMIDFIKTLSFKWVSVQTCDYLQLIIQVEEQLIINPRFSLIQYDCCWLNWQTYLWEEAFVRYSVRLAWVILRCTWIESQLYCDIRQSTTAVYCNVHPTVQLNVCTW